MLYHVNCSCLTQFSFFLTLSVTCSLAVVRQSVTCQSTDSRQLTDSRPTGFLGSSSSQFPVVLGCSGVSGLSTYLCHNCSVLSYCKTISYYVTLVATTFSGEYVVYCSSCLSQIKCTRCFIVHYSAFSLFKLHYFS